MEETVKTQEEVKKPTYEQLEQALKQLYPKAVAAEERLRQIDVVSMRLNWLFRVIDTKEKGFSEDFVKKCYTEIEELLTLDVVETPEVEEVN